MVHLQLGNVHRGAAAHNAVQPAPAASQERAPIRPRAAGGPRGGRGFLLAASQQKSWPPQGRPLPPQPLIPSLIFPHRDRPIEEGEPFRGPASRRFRGDGSRRFRGDGSRRFLGDGSRRFRGDGSRRFRGGGSRRPLGYRKQPGGPPGEPPKLPLPARQWQLLWRKGNSRRSFCPARERVLGEGRRTQVTGSWPRASPGRERRAFPLARCAADGRRPVAYK